MEPEDVVESDELRRFTSRSLALLVGDARPEIFCLASIEIGEIDLRFCGTSTTDGFPEKITETILAVVS